MLVIILILAIALISFSPFIGEYLYDKYTAEVKRREQYNATHQLSKLPLLPDDDDE